VTELCFCGAELPDTVGCVLWCDACLEEWAEPSDGEREDALAFIARKTAEAES
jgi:hypothetical protein